MSISALYPHSDEKKEDPNNPVMLAKATADLKEMKSRCLDRKECVFSSILDLARSTLVRCVQKF